MVSRRPSSFATVRVPPVGLPSASTSGVSSVMYCPSKRPSSQARIARCWLRRPNLSVSSRVMPHLSAMRSAPSNCEVISYCSKYVFGIGMPRPSSFLPPAPIGTRLITSTPHASATSTTPPCTSAVARFVACWLEPHCVSTVVAGTLSGSPADSHAVRVRLNACSPTWLTQPPTIWPTSDGSMPVRSMIAFWTWLSTSAGCMVDRPPFRLPMGVRTASTITTLLMSRAYGDARVRVHSCVRARRRA